MKKYGVDETPTVGKQASATQTHDVQVLCPRCGKRAEQHGRVFLCPTHGSKPFESLDEKY